MSSEVGIRVVDLQKILSGDHSDQVGPTVRQEKGKVAQVAVGDDGAKGIKLEGPASCYHVRMKLRGKRRPRGLEQGCLARRGNSRMQDVYGLCRLE